MSYIRNLASNDFEMRIYEESKELFDIVDQSLTEQGTYWGNSKKSGSFSLHTSATLKALLDEFKCMDVMGHLVDYKVDNNCLYVMAEDYRNKSNSFIVKGDFNTVVMAVKCDTDFIFNG